MSDDPLDKKAIRAAAFARRAETHDDEKLAFALRLAELGPELARGHGARVVSVFASIGDEVPTGLLIGRLATDGFVVGLPVTGKIGTPLVFRRWTHGTTMVPGRMGILEPPADAEVVEPDLLFVPLAAFDRRGHRIGYGAGFYDRTLAALRAKKTVVAIGVAYSVQEVLFVPSDEHDQPLDFIVTEKEILVIADEG